MTCKYCQVYLFILLILLCAQVGMAEIIPQPQQIKSIPGIFALKKTISVYLQDNYSPQNLYAAQKINQALKDRFGFMSYLTDKPKEADIILSMVTLDKAKTFGIPEEKLDESYRITIEEKLISIEALYPQGIFYGAITLAQLIEKASSPELNRMQILDWADFEFRGIADDISHGQIPTLETIKKNIDFLAKYKLNTYFLYLENALLLDDYAGGNLHPDAMSTKEIQEIVNYAAKNFIEVIPHFETLTRQEGNLANPQFERIAEFPGSGSLCPSCDYTYIYLESILKEIGAIFPSRYIHIGGEASQDIGFGKSRTWLDSLGRSSIHSYHFEKIQQICRKLGKEIIANYRLFEEFPEMQKFLKPGFIALHGNQSIEVKPAEENTFSDYFLFQDLSNDRSIFPNLSQNLKAIKLAAEQALENQALGFCVSNQSVFSYESFKELLYYPYAWTAQCAWSLEKSDQQTFDRLFFTDFLRTDPALPAEIYTLFADNEVFWKDFWRHPMLPSAKPEEAKDLQLVRQKSEILDKNMTHIQKLIENLGSKTELRRDHIDILSLTAEFGQYYALKINTQAQIQEYLRNPKDDAKTNELIALMEDHILRLENLQEKYESIWKTFYRPEALHIITQKFKRLIYYFGECKDQLLIKRSLASPLIQSKWIFDCQALDTLSCRDTAVFRKDFVLEKIPQRAAIQLMANTYAEMQINGEFVGVLSARRAQFALTEYERIKIFDIKPLLKEGNNKVIIKVINYNRGRTEPGILQGAGINAVILTRTGVKENYIYSDESWLVDDETHPKTAWKKITVRQFPYPIIAPNFLSERTSWIEK
ncbi:MAG: glycoside hydrolase family 20 zincin-like fold domain-containing protein [Microscillaceae bacterium]|nr:glycoside hydrolase family 20 zincin-like fold domain-containing protein [Microscillaceae bacterium]